ncbi:MAG: hypothetical protein KDA87_05105 [Planctomycetales bacterium]|nr:hypothetical protein [Planctomycetales bacterium]
MRTFFVTLLFTTVSIFTSQVADAAWPSTPHQEFLRWTGYGYGDGYHACPTYSSPTLPALPAVPQGSGSFQKYQCASCNSAAPSCSTCSPLVAPSIRMPSLSIPVPSLPHPQTCEQCAQPHGNTHRPIAHSPQPEQILWGVEPGQLPVRQEPPIYGYPYGEPKSQKEASKDQTDEDLPSPKDDQSRNRSRTGYRTSMKSASNGQPSHSSQQFRWRGR